MATVKTVAGTLPKLSKFNCVVRIRDDESYESWCDRVRTYEHGRAMQQVAEGKDIEQVMEQMSNRIMQKIMHPVYLDIRKSAGGNYNSEQAKAAYEKAYLKNRTPVADHVDGEIFDRLS